MTDFFIALIAFSLGALVGLLITILRVSRKKEKKRKYWWEDC